MRVRTLISTALLVALSGCNSGGSEQEIKQPANTQNQTKIYFSPAESKIPLPNDLLFQGSTDGTLAIPVVDAQDYRNPKVHLSALDGWSTIAPFFISASGKLAASSLVAGQTVHLYEVILGSGKAPDPKNPCAVVPAKVVCTAVKKLTADEFAVGLEAVSTGVPRIQITPKVALNPESAYVYALTQGIKTEQGEAVVADGPYLIAHQQTPLEASSPFKNLQGLINQIEKSTGLDSASILLAGSFSTQSVSSVLVALKKVIDASPAADLVVTTPLGNSKVYLPAATAKGNANFMAGQLKVPYYLSASNSPQDPTALSKFWQAAPAFKGDAEKNLTRDNSLPVKTGDEIIPVLLSVPTSPKPAAGWPVVIFQHGFTRSRADLIPVAETFAAAGFAAVSIDLPLHGILAAADYADTNPLKALAPALHKGYVKLDDKPRERTFGLDLQDAATGAATPDGKADASGSYFVNLASPLTTRDNLRQSVSDLMVLKKALATANVDSVAGPDFDTSRVAFVGHSLGGIVGTTFAALNPDLKSVVLVAPGGGVGKLLVDSKAFGPLILAGLKAKGLEPGTPAFEDFVWLTQTVVDAGDPLNYAAMLKANKTPVYFAEMIGNASLKLPSDVVVSNSVAGAPLSGSDPLVAALALTDVNTSTQNIEGLHVRVKFSQGEHGSLLTPDSSLGAGLPANVWLTTLVELHTEIASFIATEGKGLQVKNAAVVQ